MTSARPSALGAGLLAAAMPIAAMVATAVPPTSMIRILFMSPRWW
jgi:hypothetical protein